MNHLKLSVVLPWFSLQIYSVLGQVFSACQRWFWFSFPPPLWVWNFKMTLTLVTANYEFSSDVGRIWVLFRHLIECYSSESLYLFIIEFRMASIYWVPMFWSVCWSVSCFSHLSAFELAPKQFQSGSSPKAQGSSGIVHAMSTASKGSSCIWINMLCFVCWKMSDFTWKS